jgi:hypothetical protein
MRLEQNLGNRFLAPLFFGSLVLVSFDKRIISLYSFILLSVLFSWSETTATIQNLIRSSHENIYYISRELAGLHGKLLTSEAGRLGYYSGWLTHDSWGLNTPNYAHHMINRTDLEQNNYDLIVRHCNLEYLVTDVNPLEHQDRSLDNHCIALVSYIKSADYKIFLVPYLTDRDQDCNRNDAYGFGRYDIYAISNRYEDADKLANILTKHGAKQFPLGDDFYINTKYNKLCLGKPG